MQLQPERTCCIPRFFGFRLGIYGVGRVDEQCDDCSCGHQFVQELKPLCDHGDIKDAYARDVAARVVEAGDETSCDWVNADENDDRNRRSRRLGSECRRSAAGCHDHGHLTANEIGRQRRQPIIMPSAQRYSIDTFRPSTKPASLRPWWKLCTRFAMVVSNDTLWRNPITGIGCCARAASGRLAALPMSVMNSRRLIEPPEETPHRRLRPSTLHGRRAGKGQAIGVRRCVLMSALGHLRTSAPVTWMSASSPTTDIAKRRCDVLFVPEPEADA